MTWTSRAAGRPLLQTGRNDCAHFGATILSRMFQLDLGSLDSSVQPSQCVTVLSVKESYSYKLE